MGFLNKLAKITGVTLPEPQYTQYTDRTWFVKCMGDQSQYAGWDREALWRLVGACLENGLRNGRVSQEAIGQLLNKDLDPSEALMRLQDGLDNTVTFLPFT